MKTWSAVKRIALFLMVAALAVATIACQGAAGTQGPQGPPGPKGDPAPAPTPVEPPAPPEPAVPEVANASPTVKTPFEAIYLALQGPGKKLTEKVELGAHITDTDSVLRFSATSSDSTVATVTEASGTLTVKAVNPGTTAITVTAHDGNNEPVSAPIAVTVVKTNALPTAESLSNTDLALLEAKLYYADGAETITITAKTTAGVTDSDSVTDKVVDYKVTIGKDDSKMIESDNLLTVTVTKGTGNKHVVVLTPKLAALNKPPQKVTIKPMDMFGAASAEAWTFMATFNKTPAVLDGEFKIELNRTADGTANAIDQDPDGDIGQSVAFVALFQYFQKDSLEMAVATNAGDPPIVAAPAADTDALTLTQDHLDQIDKVGDTACVVTPSPALGVVQPLNELGLLHLTGTAGIATRVGHIAKGAQAIQALRIDSRVTKAAADGTIATPAEVPTTEGTMTVTISCSDRDATATVTGKVVIRE